MKFRLKNKNNIRIDMSFLSRIQSCSIDKIKRMRINHGNKVREVKDLFFVTGSDINYIEIINSTRYLDNVGSSCDSKHFKIIGDVGYGLAKNMSGGSITLYGNAGESACSGMSGGIVKIFGSTKNKFCCMPTGKNEGFIDGIVYVQKNVGDESIIRMRRGNIIVGGNLGNNYCSEIIAGTVIVLGKIGKNFAENSKRATFIVKDSSIARGYIRSNDTDKTFFNFYIKQMQSIVGKKILSPKKSQRFFGTKSRKDLVEVFCI